MRVASKAYSVRDLLNGFNVIAENEFVVCVKKLNPRFFERTLDPQQMFDMRKTLQAQSDITKRNDEKKRLHSCGLSYACSMRANSSR
jgi:hypothetical protein